MTDKPWESEPDHLLFESHGYVCEIRRHTPLGTLNGYVYVPRTHPIVGGEEAYELDVHGGVTFFDEVDGGFCIGFDCSHAGDYIPTWTHTAQGTDIYRDIAYVAQQLEFLAQQLKEKENAN
jgi:hypothetical protein